MVVQRETVEVEKLEVVYSVATVAKGVDVVSVVFVVVLVADVFLTVTGPENSPLSPDVGGTIAVDGNAEVVCNWVSGAVVILVMVVDTCVVIVGLNVAVGGRQSPSQLIASAIVRAASSVAVPT